MAGRLERGEIRIYSFAPPDKQRPVLALTRGSAIHYLSRVTVAPITSSIRGVPSEVVLDVGDGMKQRCAVNPRLPGPGNGPELTGASVQRRLTSGCGRPSGRYRRRGSSTFSV